MVQNEFVDDVIDFEKIEDAYYYKRIDSLNDLKEWKFLFDLDMETRNTYTKLKKYLIGKELKKIYDKKKCITVSILAGLFFTFGIQIFKAYHSKILEYYLLAFFFFALSFSILNATILYLLYAKENKVYREIVNSLFPDLEIEHLNMILQHKFLYNETYSLIEQDGTYHLSDEDKWIEKEKNFFIKDGRSENINKYKVFEIEKEENEDYILLKVYYIYVKE